MSLSVILSCDLFKDQRDFRIVDKHSSYKYAEYSDFQLVLYSVIDHLSSFSSYMGNSLCGSQRNRHWRAPGRLNMRLNYIKHSSYKYTEYSDFQLVLYSVIYHEFVKIVLC